MAFVWEQLTHDESDKLSDEYSFHDIDSGKPVKPESRVVDTDRKAFMVCLQTEPLVQSEHNPDQYSAQSVYELIWKKQRIKIKCGEHTNRKHLTFSPWISQIAAPKSLEAEKDQLVQIIKEAFKAQVYTYKSHTLKFHDFMQVSEPYFNDGEIIDPHIKISFMFKEISQRDAVELDKKYSITAIAKAKLKISDPSYVIKNLAKPLVDEQNDVSLFYLGVSGIQQGVDITEHFLVLWQSNPIYVQRKSFTFMLDKLQVVWQVPKVVAQDKVNFNESEKKTIRDRIVMEALIAYGFGGCAYTRGPVLNSSYPLPQFVSNESNVIEAGMAITDTKNDATTLHNTERDYSQSELQAAYKAQQTFSFKMILAGVAIIFWIGVVMMLLVAFR